MFLHVYDFSPVIKYAGLTNADPTRKQTHSVKIGSFDILTSTYQKPQQELYAHEDTYYISKSSYYSIAQNKCFSRQTKFNEKRKRIC